MQEVSQLIYVIRPSIAANQMANQVPSRIRKSVGRVERRNGKTVHLAVYPALPKAAVAVYAKVLRRFIPKLEMEFNGEGHFWIVVVAPRTPARHSDQRGEMIAGDSPLPAEWLIAESLDRLEGRCNRARGTVQVQIILRAVSRIVAVVRPLRESLEGDEVDAVRREGSGHLLVGVQDATVTDGIISQIPFDPLSNPRRKSLWPADTQGKGELRAVRERQQLSPSCIGDAAKIATAIVREAETPNDGQESRRHSTPSADERPQNTLPGLQVGIAQVNCGQRQERREGPALLVANRFIAEADRLFEAA